MEYTEIIIDDLYQLELGDKAILIPMTYELIDIKDLNRRSGSKTKTIVIPRTKQNDKIFGFAFNINAKNAFDKYTQRKIRIQKNSQVLFNGLCALTEVTNETISFYAFAELSKLKEIFGTRSINDLNLDDLDHTYDETIFDTWNGTYPIYTPQDYFYPLIDYGQFNNRSPLNNPEEIDVFITDVYPALYLKRAINQICIDNGYTLKTTFFDDYNTSKLLIPFSNQQFIHSNKYLINTDGFSGTRPETSPYALPSSLIQYTIPITQEISDPLFQFASDEFVSASSQAVEVNISGFVDTLGTYGVAKVFDIKLQYYNSGTATWSDLIVKDYGQIANAVPFQIKTSINLFTGDKLRFVATRYAVKLISNEILIYPNVYTIYPKDVKLNIAQGEIVQMSPNLPNIKQSDLFQWCYKMFNWVIVVDDNKGQVQISTYDSFYQNGGQKDFSQKLSLTPNATINYQPTNFSRKYDFRYKHDEKDYWLTRYDLKQTTDQPYKYGDGQYYLTQQGEATLIGDVGFSPTIIEKSWNGNDPDYIYLPTMLDIAEPTILNTQHEPRILINGGLTTIDILSDGLYSVLNVEGVGNVSDLPLCYFQKKKYNEDSIDAFELNLAFNTPNEVLNMPKNLVDTYYKSAIDSLSVSAQVTAYFKLSSKDITELDFAELWYISYFSAIFRLNRIVDYNPNSLGLTKVELINVGVLDRTPDEFGIIEPVTEYTYLDTEILEDIITENNNDIII